MSFEVHPYADKFPMLPDSELEELAESIRQNGLRQPVVLDKEGRLLDGRNRSRACEMLGIEPETVTYEGDDLAEYVIDCNVTRRNMSTGARAMAFALVMEADGRRDNGRFSGVDDFAPVQNETSLRSQISRAGVVIDFKPGLADSVVHGQTTLKDAYKQAKAIKDSEEREKIMERERRRREREEAKETAERHARIVADLTQAESKYLQMIESGDMTPDAAWAAYTADHKRELDRRRAEKQNDLTQARAMLELLERASLILLHKNQRDWCLRAMAQYGAGDEMKHYHPENHNPQTIREIAASLNEYADELETTNAA